MNDKTKRTYAIQAYPEYIECRTCKAKKKRQQFKFNIKGRIVAYKCKLCMNGKDFTLRPVKAYHKPHLTEMDIELYQEHQQGKHNTSFFNWLASGKSHFYDNV